MTRNGGDKMKLMVVLTKDIKAALDMKSASMGLNRSAYIRMVLYNDLMRKDNEKS